MPCRELLLTLPSAPSARSPCAPAHRIKVSSRDLRASIARTLRTIGAAATSSAAASATAAAVAASKPAAAATAAVVKEEVDAQKTWRSGRCSG